MDHKISTTQSLTKADANENKMLLSKNLPKPNLSQAEISLNNLQVKDDITITKSDNDWAVHCTKNEIFH